MGGKRGPSDPSNREARAQMGQQTLEIIQAQGYDHPEAGHVDLSADIAGMLAGSRYFNATEPLEVPADSRGRYQTQTSVSDRSTLEACRLLYVPGGPVPAALNFASARHPGGGFLGGAQAQEESLARSSALYASQTSDRCKVFYEAHSQRGPESWLYSDAAIFTPACPVFRADDGTLLPQPYLASFITSAAPNLTAMRDGCRKQGPGNANGIQAQVQAAQEALIVRGRRVLQVAAVCGCTRLVLGAWGAACLDMTRSL